MKNRYTAALLAFFLGWLGVHRFYLGQKKLGLLYLLFFWTYIPAIASFIDFIAFLVMDEAKFSNKYNPEIKPQDVFKATAGKGGEGEADLTLHIDSEKMISYGKQQYAKRQAEIKSFEYIQANIEQRGLQMLESAEILRTTKNLDTLISRFKFVNTFYDDLVKASHKSRYKQDVQASLDNYKSMNYDKTPHEQEVALLFYPSHDDLRKFYEYCVYKCFLRFCLVQNTEILKLKRDDAKKRRMAKIVAVADEALQELYKISAGAINEDYLLEIEKVKQASQEALV